MWAAVSGTLGVCFSTLALTVLHISAAMLMCEHTQTHTDMNAHTCIKAVEVERQVGERQ